MRWKRRFANDPNFRQPIFGCLWSIEFSATAFNPSLVLHQNLRHGSRRTDDGCTDSAPPYTDEERVESNVQYRPGDPPGFGDSFGNESVDREANTPPV